MRDELLPHLFNLGQRLLPRRLHPVSLFLLHLKRELANVATTTKSVHKCLWMTVGFG